MSNERISFYYDPQRQGYDTALWKTIGGVPAVNGNNLRLTSASIIHYGDVLRGELTLKLTVPLSPGIGQTREFGFKQLASGACATFKIVGDVFSATTSDGTNTDTTVLTWNANWAAASTTFKIVWLGFEASFYINGERVAKVRPDYTGDPSLGPVGVDSIPKGPLSIYIANGCADNLDVQVIEADNLINYI